VYPANFEYFAPTSVDEALTILERFGDDGKVLAGGMSLIPVMKLRFAAPRALVDINRVGGLDGLTTGGGVTIEALVRHRTCERAEALKGRYGVLGDAARQIADPIVRNLGTVCGSLAHADPQGDWGSVMLAVRAELVARGGSGERAIPIDETAKNSTSHGRGCSQGRSRRLSSPTRSSPRCASPIRGSVRAGRI
jgi:carbon-monoxide dehydrogenase medium subunit